MERLGNYRTSLEKKRSLHPHVPGTYHPQIKSDVRREIMIGKEVTISHTAHSIELLNQKLSMVTHTLPFKRLTYRSKIKLLIVNVGFYPRENNPEESMVFFHFIKNGVTYDTDVFALYFEKFISLLTVGQRTELERLISNRFVGRIVKLDRDIVMQDFENVAKPLIEEMLGQKRKKKSRKKKSRRKV